MDAINNYEIG